MSWVEQLLKTITTTVNSDNMKYSFKIGIELLPDSRSPSWPL